MQSFDTSHRLLGRDGRPDVVDMSHGRDGSKHPGESFHAVDAGLYGPRKRSGKLNSCSIVPDSRPPGSPSAPASPPTSSVYADLFDASPFPAVVSRLQDHTVLGINRRTSEIIGIGQDEAIGVSVSDYYVDPAERLQLAERLRRDGRADNRRIRIKKSNGEQLWVLASSRLMTWHDEPAVLTVFHDISEQVAAEATLKQSERRLATQSDALMELTARYTTDGEPFADRLRSILELAAHALTVERLSMWRFDDTHSEIACVGLLRRTTREYGSGAVLYRHGSPRYFAALERERVIAAHDAMTDARTAEFGEGYLRPSGIGAMLDVPLRYDNATIGVLCAEHVGGPRIWTVDEQNFAISVSNLVVVALSEDERRGALARLAESDARARLIVDTAHDAFIGIDSAGMIVSWNAQAEATFGWTRDEIHGHNLAETIIPPGFRDAHNNGLKRFHATGEAPVVNQRLELTAVHRSGREFPVELTVTSPMAVDGGYFFGAFLRDISDRRQRDADLRRAKDAAEAATRAKSEFLANMSHELRTPLNGVLGYAQLLQRDRGFNPSQREALEAIAKCGSQLLDLINDVLDLSKIEAGRLEIEEAPTDLEKLATDVRSIVAAAAERKGLDLSLTVASDVPRSVVLDGRHLRQVLLNLLGNAVKFTQTGTVQLSIARSEAGHLQFDVIDTGPGIEPGSLSAIFEAFSQTETGAAAGGTGLGLTISDHLISSMGGRLSVDSVPGKGSRFWFTLPLIGATDTARAIDEDTDTSLPPLDARLAPGQFFTALVVDDSTANQHILASLLESAGLSVITASGGLEAIELARTRQPSVVFMDVKMADLDGLEATRRLAGDPATAAIPVVAVTASALGDARQAARNAGCVDYLSKPIRAQLLFAMLQKHLGARFVSTSGQSVPADAAAGVIEHRAELAGRLRSAIGVGDVGDLHALAQELMANTGAAAALGERISRLATHFDFDGLEDIAKTLTA
jgi:PAS domain S-box-containing protein